MLGILKRDLLLILTDKQIISILILYVPLLLFLADSYVPEIMYYVILIAYTYIMLMTPFTYDVKGQSKYIMTSMPITRREFVLYKYISTFFYLALTIVYVGVYLWIINLLNLVTVDYFNLDMIVKAIPMIMIFVSIVFPSYFKFDYKIGRIIQMILFLTFFITVGNMAFTGNKGVLGLIENLQWDYIMIGAIILYILSLLLSIKIYKNRDL